MSLGPLFSALVVVLSLGYFSPFESQESVLLGLGVLVASLAAILLVLKIWAARTFPSKRKGTIGIFHPHANGGGGGERVLWCAIQALQQALPEVKLVLYSRASLGPTELSEAAASKFNLQVAPSFEVVPLLRTSLLDPGRYPRFTLLGQAWGSVGLGFEALRQCVPEVFLDTTGWAFCYPLARLVGSRVAAYVHYPTVSKDMLARVASRQPGYNNDAAVASSPLRSAAKVAYYHAFAAAYAAVGACANVVMVNSSWTLDHIAALWWHWDEPVVVYPPCDTLALQALPLDRKLKRLYLISVAQFRPEKDHAMQLRALAAARAQARAHPSASGDAVLAGRLVLVGGVRGEEDRMRLQALQELAVELGISEVVDWRPDVHFDELRGLLGGAVGGLHSMVDEHFGISVVEYMAAGVVPIAHNSGGPRRDIVLSPPDAFGSGSAYAAAAAAAAVGGNGGGPGSAVVTTRMGYLCRTLEEYVAAITEVLSMGQLERMRMAEAARKHASQFSDESFKRKFLQAMLPLVQGRAGSTAAAFGSSTTPATSAS